MLTQIGFNFCLEFSFTDGSVGKDVIIFEADMSWSVHIDIRNENIIILGEGQHKG